MAFVQAVWPNTKNIAVDFILRDPSSGYFEIVARSKTRIPKTVLGQKILSEFPFRWKVSFGSPLTILRAIYPRVIEYNRYVVKYYQILTFSSAIRAEFSSLLFSGTIQPQIRASRSAARNVFEKTFIHRTPITFLRLEKTSTTTFVGKLKVSEHNNRKVKTRIKRREATDTSINR